MNVDKDLNMVAESSSATGWISYKAKNSQNFDEALWRFVFKYCWIVTCFAILLLLTGCETSSRRKIEDMALGEYTYTDAAQNCNEEYTFEAEKQTEDSKDMYTYPTETVPSRPPVFHKKTTFLSMQGYYDCPNHQALGEWLDFRESYDVDKSLLNASDQTGSDIPVDYFAYGCYTWDMVNKVDEILEKYDLALLTNQELVQYDQPELWLDSLNIDGIFREGANIDYTYAGGYFYSEGTFQMECNLQLTQKDAAWPYSVYPCYRYSVKSCFDPAYLSVGDVDSYEQWKYTASDGNEMLLALNSERALIVCEQDEAVITVYMKSHSGQTDGEQMSQLALEQIAEVFDFSICPI